jgi:site-specific DNA recombinase
LLRLIGQARRLHDLVMTGFGKTIRQLAAEVGLSPSYFTRIFRLSFLAPEVTRAILQGRQPPELTASKLMLAGKFAPAWPDQRRQLGVT